MSCLYMLVDMPCFIINIRLYINQKPFPGLNPVFLGFPHSSPPIPSYPRLPSVYIEARVCRPDVDGIFPLRLKHHLTELWHMLSDPNGHQTSPHYPNTIDKSSDLYLIIPFWVVFYITLLNDIIWWNQRQILQIPWKKAHVFTMNTVWININLNQSLRISIYLLWEYLKISWCICDHFTTSHISLFFLPVRQYTQAFK